MSAADLDRTRDEQTVTIAGYIGLRIPQATFELMAVLDGKFTDRYLDRSGERQPNFS